MVGVPRSRGCSTCIKRRVKCDETKPACAKCDVYGTSCPGYERSFKFVDRMHSRPQLSGSRKEVSTLDGDVNSSTSFFAVSHSSTSKEIFLRSSKRSSSNLAYSTIPSPAMQKMQLLSTWIEDISGKASQIPDEVTIARLFCFIPACLGCSSALDSAVHCLTVHYLGIQQGNEEITRYGRLAYGKALCSIQKAIDDPVEAMKSTTLCATMVLSLYELFACTKVDSWMKHTAGLRKLMQLRGPKSFENSFDSAMLLACKGVIIMEALFSGKACFLDSKEWRHIILKSPGDGFSAALYEHTEELGRCIAACPWLVKEAYALRSNSISPHSTELRISALIHRTLEIHGQLQHWYEVFTTFAPLPKEVPSSNGDDLYPVVYSYCNSCIATVFSGYYAMIIIVHTILVDCHHPTGNAHNINTMIDNICKSVEYLAGTGILGPYRVGFSIRVAFEVATIRTKVWIRKWLVQFEKFYRACSPENYPPIETKNHETSMSLS